MQPRYRTWIVKHFVKMEHSAVMCWFSISCVQLVGHSGVDWFRLDCLLCGLHFEFMTTGEPQVLYSEPSQLKGFLSVSLVRNVSCVPAMQLPLQCNDTVLPTFSLKLCRLQSGGKEAARMSQDRAFQIKLHLVNQMNSAGLAVVSTVQVHST